MSNGIVHRADHGIVCVPKFIFKDETLTNEDKGILTTIVYFVEDDNDEIDISELEASTGKDVNQLIKYFDILSKHGYAILVLEQ